MPAIAGLWRIWSTKTTAKGCDGSSTASSEARSCRRSVINVAPSDRWHGLSADDFIAQRPYMRMSGAHIWQMTHEQLSDELVLRWMVERLSQGS